MIFPDFYEWILYTLNLIDKNNLNIAIKPHPNGLVNNLSVVSDLKREFPNVKWIDSKVSNNTIFNSGIKFGVSVYGTVLYELAFHNIQAISAGDNPTMSFGFVNKPSTIKEYKDYLINFDESCLASINRNDVLACHFMHTKSHKDGIKTHLNELDINVFYDYESSILRKV